MTQGQVASSQEDKAPDFTLPKYDGAGDINLAAAYNEKPTVIQFWATWCEFCREEFPKTSALMQTYKDTVYYIAVDWRESNRTAVQEYIKELGLDPTVLTFVMDASGTVGGLYGVRGTPVHVFIKKGGEVSRYQVGFISPQMMEEEIKNIL